MASRAGANAAPAGAAAGPAVTGNSKRAGFNAASAGSGGGVMNRKMHELDASMKLLTREQAVRAARRGRAGCGRFRSPDRLIT
jgi:hypothetical protein